MVRAGVQVRAVVRVVRPLDRTNANYSVQRAIPQGGGLAVCYAMPTAAPRQGLHFIVTPLTPSFRIELSCNPFLVTCKLWVPFNRLSWELV